MTVEAAGIVQIDIPIATTDPGEYRSTHVDAQLDARQAEALHRMFHGLDFAGARLRNGRRVASKVDVVRWLLEKAAGKYTDDTELTAP